MTDFTQHTPVSEALGSSFVDLGGVGQQPANLMQGLAMNGITPSPGISLQAPKTGFDDVLKAPAMPEPPLVKPQPVAPFKPGG